MYTITPTSKSADESLAVHKARAYTGETTDGLVWVLAIVGIFGEFWCNGYHVEFIPGTVADELRTVACTLTSFEVAYWIETQI